MDKKNENIHSFIVDQDRKKNAEFVARENLLKAWLRRRSSEESEMVRVEKGVATGAIEVFKAAGPIEVSKAAGPIEVSRVAVHVEPEVVKVEKAATEGANELSEAAVHAESEIVKVEQGVTEGAAEVTEAAVHAESGVTKIEKDAAEVSKAAVLPESEMVDIEKSATESGVEVSRAAVREFQNGKDQNLKIVLAMHTLVVTCSLVAIVSLFGLDAIVNQTLYSFGLKFSYDWATPYWIALRTTLGMLFLTIIAAMLYQVYLLRYNRGSKGENGQWKRCSLPDGSTAIVKTVVKGIKRIEGPERARKRFYLVETNNIVEVIKKQEPSESLPDGAPFS